MLAMDCMMNHQRNQIKKKKPIMGFLFLYNM